MSSVWWNEVNQTSSFPAKRFFSENFFIVYQWTIVMREISDNHIKKIIPDNFNEK